MFVTHAPFWAQVLGLRNTFRSTHGKLKLYIVIGHSQWQISKLSLQGMITISDAGGNTHL